MTRKEIINLFKKEFNLEDSKALNLYKQLQNTTRESKIALKEIAKIKDFETKKIDVYQYYWFTVTYERRVMGNVYYNDFYAEYSL